MLTGRVVKLKEAKGANPIQAMKRLVARSGESTIRLAVRRAVRLLGEQFVLGTTIESALSRAHALEAKGYRFSYDMLGETARSERDAERYFQRYMEAIDAVGTDAGVFTAHERRRCFRAAVDLGEAVGAASALRTGERKTASRRVGAAAVDAGSRGARARASASPSTRKSRTGSTSRRSCSARRSSIRSWMAGTVLASPCRPMASAPSR